MRIESENGHTIQCGHIFPYNKIVIGSRWQSWDGEIVTVESVDSHGLVKYNTHKNGVLETHVKDSFSFQCKYCLIVE